MESNVNIPDPSNEVAVDSNIYENTMESDSESDSSTGITRPTEVANSEFTETDTNIALDSDFNGLDLVEIEKVEIVTAIGASEVADEALYGGTLKFTSEYTDYALSYQNVHLQFSPTLSSFGPGIIYSRILKFKTGPEVIQPSLEFECDVCESWQMTSPTRFEFKLREGVK